MPPAIPAAAVERLVAALVAIDSVNPSLVPGGAGESAIASFAAGWMTDAGLEAEVIEPVTGRPSVVGRARGRGGGPSLMLCGHLDTVGTGGMADPHTPRVAGGRLHGRGSYDMKAGVAACMLAAAAAAAAAGEARAGDVIVAAVADEEHSSIGIQAVLERVRADACIVAEPTSLDVVVAHKGFAWWEITAAGRAAHGSRPDLGADAIVAMGPVLAGLAALERDLAARPHALLGPASVHASLIDGGQELSSYPDRCVLAVERRTLPGETAQDAGAELERLVSGAAGGACEITGRTLLVRPPFEADPADPIVALLRERAGKQLGGPPAVRGHSAWMDAAFTSAAGIPTVVFGPDGAGAHAVEEWVDLDSTRACASVLLATALEFCA